MSDYDRWLEDDSELLAECSECEGDEETCICDPWMRTCSRPGRYGCRDCFACDEWADHELDRLDDLDRELW